jgi:hydrogenase nickel incorporation protein HypB
MCDKCGCSSGGGAVMRRPGNDTGHVHIGEDGSHAHHDRDHEHGQSRKIEVEQDVLLKNNLLAERNRGYFDAKHVLVLNFLSSPGSGKTTLLEKTIPLLKDERPVTVIEGDQQTTNDAERIDALGVPVIQINTGTGCHLDAEMVHRAVRELDPPEHSFLFIENVGNLVCPAMFDLGESARVVVISVTEGEDKPLKYPTMFRHADLCLLNKTDLLPYVDFDAERCRQYALQVNHRLQWLEISAKTGKGLDQWTAWVRSRLAGL